MSDPLNVRVVCSFQLWHEDATDGTQRQLTVAVDDQENTYLSFVNKPKVGGHFQTDICLGEIGLDMLYHALTELQERRPAHMHSSDAIN